MIKFLLTFSLTGALMFLLGECTYFSSQQAIAQKAIERNCSRVGGTLTELYRPREPMCVRLVQ